MRDPKLAHILVIIFDRQPTIYINPDLWRNSTFCGIKHVITLSSLCQDRHLKYPISQPTCQSNTLVILHVTGPCRSLDLDHECSVNIYEYEYEYVRLEILNI